MAMTLEEVSRGYERLRAVREIENIMGRYSFFHTSMRHIDYLKLWSQRDDCILDMPWGGYTGYKGVEQCYLLDHGDRSCPETQEFMIGLLPMHTHTTGVIEVAKDLKTARGCWLSPGHETFAEDGKGEGTWAWSKIGADFIQEDGLWKVWRMRVYGCIQCGYHTCWTDMPPYQGSLPEAHCDRPVRSVANYHPDYVYPADEPLPPEPYETYDDVGYIW